MTLTLFQKWIKKNAITILLVIAIVCAIVLTVLGFWVKIRGFKISSLVNRLQVAQAKNEVSYLHEKRAVLATKSDVKKEEIDAIEAEIKEEEKKVVKARLEIEGLESDEIADRLTKLGF